MWQSRHLTDVARNSTDCVRCVVSLLCCAQVADDAKRSELAGLFGLTSEDIADISRTSDKEAEKQKEEEEAFFL